MSRRVIPGLEPPDATLESEVRTRLDQVEEALEKSVQVEASGMLTETSSYLIAAGGKRFRAMLVLLAGYFGDPARPAARPRLGLDRAGAPRDAVPRRRDRRGRRPPWRAERERPLGQHGRDPHRRLPLRPCLGDLDRSRHRCLPAPRPHDRGALRRADPRGRRARPRSSRRSRATSRSSAARRPR